MAEKERPKPGDYPEISRGSGPAAILLFLHIALTGYLGFVIYYLLRNNEAVYWNLLPFSAALFFYFPAAMAIIAFLPTDKLTKMVGSVARFAGLFAVVVYVVGLITLDDADFEKAGGGGLETACAVAAGVAGGLLARVIFALGIRRKSDNYEKNDTAER